MISLQGMYDIHVHPAPSIRRRRFTAIQALKLAHEEKMAGILFVDHTYNTTVVADTVNELGLISKAFGAIFLNEAAGCLSPSVVEAALSLGTKQIEMPTYSSKKHYDTYGDDQNLFPYKLRIKPIYILDDRGQLINEVEEILEVMKGKDAFLGTGHIYIQEINALVSRTKELGIKLLVNSVSTDKMAIPLDAQKTWTDDNVFIEHDYIAITDVNYQTAPANTVAAQIHSVGAGRCVLGTDSGSMKLPDNVTAMKNFVEKLLEAGITEKEIDLMTRINPKRLLTGS